MSDTPRTDANAEPRGDGWKCDVVRVDFARELERELAAKDAQIAALRNLCDRALKMMQMAGYGVVPQDGEHNNPIIAWMADARAALAGSEALKSGPSIPQDAVDGIARRSLGQLSEGAALTDSGSGSGWAWALAATTALREIAGLAERSLTDDDRGREAVEIAERELCRQHEEHPETSLALALGKQPHERNS